MPERRRLPKAEAAKVKIELGYLCLEQPLAGRINRSPSLRYLKMVSPDKRLNSVICAWSNNWPAVSIPRSLFDT